MKSIDACGEIIKHILFATVYYVNYNSIVKLIRKICEMGNGHAVNTSLF